MSVTLPAASTSALLASRTGFAWNLTCLVVVVLLCVLLFVSLLFFGGQPPVSFPVRGQNLGFDAFESKLPRRSRGRAIDGGQRPGALGRNLPIVTTSIKLLSWHVACRWFYVNYTFASWYKLPVELVRVL